MRYAHTHTCVGVLVDYREGKVGFVRNGIMVHELTQVFILPQCVAILLMCRHNNVTSTTVL